MTKRKRLLLRIRGRVQGVAFRASTQQKARALELTGFVENRPDGTVYAEAEGDAADLQLFLAWCKKGPPLARVDQVDISEEPPFGYDEFSIRR